VDARAVETLARTLLEGKLPPEAQPWELGAAVESIADALPGPADEITAAQVRRACEVLNDHRHFEQTRLLGQAWSDCRDFDATVQRRLAQALINLSALAEAQPLLEDGLARLHVASSRPLVAVELPEYEGLLARLLKQRFVSNADPDSLLRATDAYLATYQRDPAKHYWHGINAAALLARQHREGLGSTADANAAEALAGEIRSKLHVAWNNDPANRWLASTLSEACLALGLCDEAELWLYRFLHHPEAKPFDIDSYDRQLREIWKGNPLGPGPVCPSRLAAIVAQHVLRSQSRFSVSSGMVQRLARQLAADPEGFERNFSGEGLISFELLRNMVTSCASIGCVSRRSTGGERLGSGFLVSGELLRAGWGPGPVFVTNAHVISTEVASAISPQDALVSFEVESTAAGVPVYYRVADLLYSSPPGDLGMRCAQQDHLDVTIVRIERTDGMTSVLPCLDFTPRLPLIDAKARAYVVGHPLGSGLQVSLHDSELLDIDDDQRLVHYRTPTDPGSSGSPVFNGSWKVIALHHGGSSITPRLHGRGKYEANEGISLGAVRRRLNA
jgi:hypothetical protein